MSALLTYALDENKKLVHIDSVKKGGACKCVCPHCNKSLDAKNGGEIREHHFAHSHGNTCEGAYETALHMLAKEVILEEQCIMLPISDEGSFPSGLVKLHHVEQEKWDNTFGFRPDIEGIMENGERLLIEILVSHKVQRKKHDIILKNNLKCIEVDMNWVDLDKSTIRTFLLNDVENRKWITSYEDKPIGNGEGYSYPRNPLHKKAIEYLKEKFDKDSIVLGFWHGEYDLKKHGYDVCEPLSRKFRGIKSDLLLYRSNKTDKGYISICIRGRRRNFDHKLPKNLRVIDIIIRDASDYNRLVDLASLHSNGNNYVFEGFKEKERDIDSIDNMYPFHMWQNNNYPI